MKKIKKLLILILFSSILGFVLSFLMHNGHWERLINGLKSIKIYTYPLILIVSVFLVILIHELGHLFSFVFNKIKIRAILVLIFMFLKDDNNKPKFKVFPKYIKLLGGIVVPNLGEIKNEEDLKNLREKFAKALIAGPNTSIGYFILTVISFLIIWFLTDLRIILGLFTLNMILTGLFTVIVIISSKLNTKDIFGDYVARQKMIDDEKFALAIISQYKMYSNIKDNQTSKFFYEYLTKYYKENNLTYNTYDQNLTGYLIDLFLDSKDTKNLTINKILGYYNINRLINSDTGIELSYLISAAYYKLKDPAKAYEIFNLIQIHKTEKLEPNKLLILKKQYEHLLNINDNNEFFKNSINEYLDNFSILAPLVNQNELLEELNKSIEFVPYYTELYCELR